MSLLPDTITLADDERVRFVCPDFLELASPDVGFLDEDHPARVCAHLSEMTPKRCSTSFAGTACRVRACR